MHPPFPNLPFGIVFIAILVAGLGYAAYADWMTMKVPKWLTVGLCCTGIVTNAICGAWLFFEGAKVWLFDPVNVFVCAVDGVLLSLVGFIVGFVSFFVFWIFGLCGGGDVKLVGATGAWLGPILLAWGVVLSLPFLVILTLSVLAYRLARGKLPQPAIATPTKGRQRSVTTYSLPFALGVYVVLSVWMLK